YVPRPIVEPELFASLRPPTYSGDMAKRDEGKPEGAARKKLHDADDDQKGAERKLKEAAGAWGKLPAKERRAELSVDALNAVESEGLDLRRGVTAAASAARLGDFFRYAFDKPVSLARQKSALLPIVNQGVEADRVSIYNERTQAKFPLLGLKFKNTSGLHL